MITVPRTPTTAAIGIAVLAVLAGCGSSSPKSSTAPTSTTSSAPATTSAPTTAAPATAAPSAAGAALKVGTPKFSGALTDSTGKSLYMFTADTGSTSTCAGACASAWPPFTTTGTPSITGGDMAKLGTTTRADGTTQITYNGHPLYYFSGDAKPGDTNGEGSKAFGAEWYLIGTDGNKIDNS